jgi:HlyD family secretion protein
VTYTRLAFLLLGLAVVGLAGIGAIRVYEALKAPSVSPVPFTKVKRGDVAFTITSQGSLQGGNSKVLTAPMTGSRELILTELRKSGELVNEGDVVAQFDTTEETFKLREAESDLLEAEQQVLQAKNETLAREEELTYELLKAGADHKLAELECRRNELLATMVAKQNNLALLAAKERLDKLQHDYVERKNAAQASIAIQEASRKKAQMQAETARRNIGLMTLKAPMKGYVNVEKNTNSNFFFPGMQFPLLQIGDAVRAGLGVVQIPDLTSWEVTAQINEQDRGHIALNQASEIRVMAAGKKFTGKVTNLGGTSGPPWNRRFECKLSLDSSSPELRPGMSAQIVIRTETIPNAIWIPAQALFESDSRRYVYVRSGNSFTTKDVTLVRRSESQAVLTGLNEGELVALANPTAHEQQNKGPASAPTTPGKATGK